MKAAIYARCSTRDKEQNPLTQLLPIREAVKAMGAEVYGEFVDTASAQDIRGRTAWRRLLDDAAKRKFDVVVVFRSDRAFRSVKDMHDSLAAWKLSGVDFKSVCEGFDTSSAQGRLMLNILASLSEFELAMISEGVHAGMDRAAIHGTRSGKPIGRPRVEVPVQKLLNAYRVSRSIRGAAQVAGCTPGTAYGRLRDSGLLDELPPVRGC